MTSTFALFGQSLGGVVCAAAALLLTAPTAQAAGCDATAGNLVANCGFETGDFSGWTLSGNDVPGAEGNLYGVENADPLPTPAGTAPQSGAYQAFFADQAADATTLTQTLATTAGGQYTVSFYLAQQLVGPGTVANQVAVSFDGTAIGSLSNVDVEGYTYYSFAGTASGASTVFSLTLGNDIGEFLVDDVAVAVTPVPEPTSSALLLGGLAALGLARKRIRRNG